MRLYYQVKEVIVMLNVSGTEFQNIYGVGAVGVNEEGSVCVRWLAEGAILPKWYRARRVASKTASSGSRWVFYEPRPGQHNRSVHIPESCVLRAIANKEAQHDNN